MSGWLDPDLAKLGIAGGLAAGTMIFASIPVLLSRRASSEHSGVKHMLSGLSCLGGGVFLATCFLHLIPEAIEKMDAALKSSKVETKDFPVAYAIVIAGFLLVLISDQFVQRFNKDHINLGHSHGPVRTNAGPVPVPNYGAIHRNAALHSSPGSDELGEIDHPVEDTVEDSDEEDRMTTVSMHGDPGSHKPFRVIVLVFALSLHSFFEGLAVGLQKSTQDVFQLFGAIMVHKSVIAITISTNLVSTTRLKTCGIFTAIGVFSAMAPIGILFALLLDDAPALVVGVLQCIAAGTFVYITFFEILPHELNSASTERSRLFKTLALVAGILIVIGLMYALPEDHDDHHHDSPTTTTTMAPNISTTTVS